MNTKRNNTVAPIVVTSIRMTPEQHRALKDIAAQQHRTVSQELRVAIDAHLVAMREAA